MSILLVIYAISVLINTALFVIMVVEGDIFIQPSKRPFLWYALIFLAIFLGFVTWVLGYILYRLHRADVI